MSDAKKNVQRMLEELDNIVGNCLDDLERDDMDNLACGLDEMGDVLAMVVQRVEQMEESGA